MKRKLNERDVPEAVGDDVSSKSSFASFGLDSRLLQAVNREKFTAPTPVQTKAIPLTLEGKDVLGMAKPHVILPSCANMSQPGQERGLARRWPTSYPPCIPSSAAKPPANRTTGPRPSSSFRPKSWQGKSSLCSRVSQPSASKIFASRISPATKMQLLRALVWSRDLTSSLPRPVEQASG